MRSARLARSSHVLAIRLALPTALLLTAGLSPAALRAQLDPVLELLTHGEAGALLQAQQTGEGPIKCGFSAVLAALSEMGRAASEVIQARPQIYNVRTFPSPGGKFLLHYTLDGIDAVPAEDLDADGVPDWIETAAASLDSIRAWYLARDWREPVNDGNGVYDIYFLDLESIGGYFGYTAPIDPMTIIPPYTAASYIVLENDYPQSWYGLPPLASLRVTAAHEYHHAIQLAYNLCNLADWRRYFWFAEASAVYHEEQIYDGINDYVNYIRYFLDIPYMSLSDGSDSASLHWYGAVVWTLMLGGVYGPDAVRGIWTVMAEEPAAPVAAHRLWLAGQGSSLLDTYATFTEWILHTGTRAVPDRYYEEGASFPRVLIDELDLSSTDVTLPPLAARFYRSSPPDRPGGVAIRVQPDQEAQWGIGIAGADAAGIGTVATRIRRSSSPLDGPGIELFDQNAYDQIIRWSFAGDNYSQLNDSPLIRTAVLVGEESGRLVSAVTAGEGFTLQQNYPNPFRPDGRELMYIAFDLASAGDVHVDIRTLTGARLWTHTFTGLPAGQCFSDDLAVGWNGRDERGNEVPAGVYVLVAEHAGTTRYVTFSVLR